MRATSSPFQTGQLALARAGAGAGAASASEYRLHEPDMTHHQVGQDSLFARSVLDTAAPLRKTRSMAFLCNGMFRPSPFGPVQSPHPHLPVAEAPLPVTGRTSSTAAVPAAAAPAHQPGVTAHRSTLCWRDLGSRADEVVTGALQACLPLRRPSVGDMSRAPFTSAVQATRHAGHAASTGVADSQWPPLDHRSMLHGLPTVQKKWLAMRAGRLRRFWPALVSPARDRSVASARVVLADATAVVCNMATPVNVWAWVRNAQGSGAQRQLVACTQRATLGVVDDTLTIHDYPFVVLPQGVTVTCDDDAQLVCGHHFVETFLPEYSAAARHATAAPTTMRVGREPWASPRATTRLGEDRSVAYAPPQRSVLSTSQQVAHFVGDAPLHPAQFERKHDDAFGTGHGSASRWVAPADSPAQAHSHGHRASDRHQQPPAGVPLTRGDARRLAPGPPGGGGASQSGVGRGGSRRRRRRSRSEMQSPMPRLSRRWSYRGRRSDRR